MLDLTIIESAIFIITSLTIAFSQPMRASVRRVVALLSIALVIGGCVVNFMFGAPLWVYVLPIAILLMIALNGRSLLATTLIAFMIAFCERAWAFINTDHVVTNQTLASACAIAFIVSCAKMAIFRQTLRR